ncbi:MAG: cell division protein ZipA C-terminal FtsZ-binding domain-containing protein [Gammaproteobacteria bacterium]|nr:cell division protein ZipA C-terminal FtsZ-binding domain-containing protein [Gammaproteobacteria bacterium]
MLAFAIIAVVLAGLAGMGVWRMRRRRNRYRALTERGEAALRERGTRRTSERALDHLDAAESLSVDVDVDVTGDAYPQTGHGHGSSSAAGSRRHRDQLELGFGATAKAGHGADDPGDSGREPACASDELAGEPVRAGATTERVIVLHIEVEPHRRITGPDVLDAMGTVGMRHGDLQIFHHFGIGRMRAAEPLFSAANMFEPGCFDLEHMDALETRGLALFMKLPGPIEANIAFELMLNTAQRLADILGAQVCDSRHRPLDAGAIAALRESITAPE